MYTEDEHGNVTITLTVLEFTLLVGALGQATGAALKGLGYLSASTIWTLANRINEGNPRWTPYKIEGEADAGHT